METGYRTWRFLREFSYRTDSSEGRIALSGDAEKGVWVLRIILAIAWFYVFVVYGLSIWLANR